MSRVENILKRVRDTLADPRKERWKDDRLIRLLSEAVLDISKTTRYLRGVDKQFINYDQAEYLLPADTYAITRVAVQDTVVPICSMDEMDIDFGINWFTHRGRLIKRIVHNSNDFSRIRVYPVPTENMTAYEVEGAGVTTEFTSPFGVLTEIEETEGVVSDAVSTGSALVVWYVRLHKEFDDSVAVEDQPAPDFPAMFDTAIKHYIVGQAFLDDLDQRGQQAGALAMQQYTTEIARLKNLAAGARRSDSGAYTVPYRSGF